MWDRKKEMANWRTVKEEQLRENVSQQVIDGMCFCVVAGRI